MIFDTNHDVSAKIAALKAVPVKTVLRYISTNTAGEKCIKPAEAKAIAQAGLRLGLVFEVWGGEGGFEHHDISNVTGKQHGAFVKGYMPTLGAPPSAVCYFAIDTDVTDDQVRDIVRPYFAGVKDGMGGAFKVGAYGCGAVCDATLTCGYASQVMLSNAMSWNGTKQFLASNKAALVQRLPKTILGFDTDPDDLVLRHDIGDFVPFGKVGAKAPIAPKGAGGVVSGVGSAIAAHQAGLSLWAIVTIGVFAGVMAYSFVHNATAAKVVAK